MTTGDLVIYSCARLQRTYKAIIIDIRVDLQFEQNQIRFDILTDSGEVYNNVLARNLELVNEIR